MATISVIIPAYNAERTILETIKSVLQQTFSDFELIIINDGSTDQTLELVKTIEDSRLKIFSYSNAGLSIARNRGIYHATGEFIAFLDADDLWTSDKLELQLAALQKHPEAGLAYSWTLNMSETAEIFHPGHNVVYEGNVYDKLLLSNFISNGSNPLIRKQAIESAGEFDPTLSSVEDWDYWFRVAEDWDFAVVPKPQILYRHSSKSMSTKVEKMEKYLLIVLERGFQAAPPELQNLKNRSLANIYQYLTGMELAHVTNREQVNQAGRKLWKTVSLYPQILLERVTQRYLIKWLVMQVFSPQIAKYLTRPFSLARSVAVSRLQ
ncbi:glycosyltransferase family 2 protein [Nostoc sp.]|uniref:glycosyltransferase family 2 protein n=1 Tax=Nostoc sp. TaxID=1180 RepID=UPI002FFCD23A